jgi:hypothetical protein
MSRFELVAEAETHITAVFLGLVYWKVIEC